MIDQIDEEVIQWVKDTIGGDVTPSLAVPTNSESLSVNLYLLEIVDDRERRSGSKPSYQPTLRYLVSTHSADIKEAHRLLSILLYAAMENQKYEVDLEPISTFLWTAFQIAPQPAFILKIPLPYEWKSQSAKLVRILEPVLQSSAPIVPLYGQVLGPDDIPLMNARVELPNLFLSAITDCNGRFILAGVPAAPKPKNLLIKARRKEKTELIRQTGTPDEPVVIQFNSVDSEGGN